MGGAANTSLRQLDRLSDRIRLHKQVDSRQVAIVEGASDERILARAFGKEEIVYFQAGTRSLALDAAKQLVGWGKDYFVCIVDRDFDDEVDRENGENPHLHPYENADLEAMLAVSTVGVDLIAELGSEGKIAARGGIPEIIAKLYEMVQPVATLRRANIENGWGLAFDKVDLVAKIDKKNMLLKVQSYCAALSDVSEGSPGQAVLIEYANGTRTVSAPSSCPRGSTPFFRGRDFLAILCAALCGYCGSKRPQAVDPESLAESLRLAGADYLRTSRWGKDLLSIIRLSE
ncbi:hypothetical protein [Streptomyces antibioticus]|uniref:hypothetical protein n=1 Tax=Streptomyces antibioticus TaxID=1890 RepID=UPI0037A9B70A